MKTYENYGNALTSLWEKAKEAEEKAFNEWTEEWNGVGEITPKYLKFREICCSCEGLERALSLLYFGEE